MSSRRTLPGIPTPETWCLNLAVFERYADVGLVLASPVGLASSISLG